MKTEEIKVKKENEGEKEYKWCQKIFSKFQMQIIYFQ